jgi:hypothetical protein
MSKRKELLIELRAWINVIEKLPDEDLNRITINNLPKCELGKINRIEEISINQVRYDIVNIYRKMR